MSNAKLTLLKLTSWLFRIIGLGCIVFGIYFMLRVRDSRSVNDYYDIVPELYMLILVGSVFIPGIAGLFSFVIGGLIDIRVAITRSNKPPVN